MMPSSLQQQSARICFEIKARELDLREQEMKRQRMKDESLAGLMRHYGEALKHAIPKWR